GLQLDAVQVQCRWIARPLFPEREPRQGARSQLASRAKGAIQSDDAPVRAEVGSADRQMESAAGREDANNGGDLGAMKVDGHAGASAPASDRANTIILKSIGATI